VVNLPDSLWAAGWQADGLLRTGGTTSLPPDSDDRLVEFYALGLNFQTSYEESSAYVSGLSRHRDVMLGLLFDMLRNPRNDTTRIRETVAQVEESWRRRNDQPGSILNRAWNQVMYGEHPLAKTMATPEEAAALTPDRLRVVDAMLFCPDRMIVGVTGDFDTRAMTAKLEELFRGWGRCPAGTRPTPPVRFPQGPRVVLIEKDVNQSNIQMGQAGGIRVADTPEYFAASHGATAPVIAKEFAATSNPATAAGILGVILGYDKIPAYWKPAIEKVQDLKFPYPFSRSAFLLNRNNKDPRSQN
jgi:predicted Zn-dependent peptidase